MAEMTKAFPDREFSGIGGISTFEHALNYFLLGCGTVQVATAAMLDHAIGPNVIAALTSGMTEFLERNAHRGWTSLADFRGMRRGNVVPHAQIARPGASDYHGGYEEEAEGYASPGRGVEPPSAQGRRRPETRPFGPLVDCRPVL